MAIIHSYCFLILTSEFNSNNAHFTLQHPNSAIMYMYNTCSQIATCIKQYWMGVQLQCTILFFKTPLKKYMYMLKCHSNTAIGIHIGIYNVHCIHTHSGYMYVLYMYVQYYLLCVFLDAVSCSSSCSEYSIPKAL